MVIVHCVKLGTGSIRFSFNSFLLFVSPSYQPPGKNDNGVHLQYAVAINVPADQCGPGFSQDNFLSEDSAEKVKEDLEHKNLYKGSQLVAATPKGTGQTNAVHSECALLMCEDSDGVTPMQDLLNKKKDGCVVFYTYNSPCLKLCLNQAKDKEAKEAMDKKITLNRKNIQPLVQKCILESLIVLTNHVGPKAFVFSRVYIEDLKSEALKAALKVVADKVPLYKCDADSCFKCLDNGQIIEKCLS